MRKVASLGAGVLAMAWALAGCGGAADAEAGPIYTSGGEMTAEGNTNAPPPEQSPYGAGSVYGGGAAAGAPQGYPGRTGSGRSAEDPVSACGPRDSYIFVASEFQCPEGGNPLGGDPMAGARSRAGNVGANSTGHIIDLYQVPCPSGTVDVYVDMYGCPEMQGMFGQ